MNFLADSDAGDEERDDGAEEFDEEEDEDGNYIHVHLIAIHENFNTYSISNQMMKMAMHRWPMSITMTSKTTTLTMLRRPRATMMIPIWAKRKKMMQVQNQRLNNLLKVCSQMKFFIFKFQS